MYLFIFQEKLKKLNAALYVDVSKATNLNSEWKVAAIRLRKGRAESGTRSDTSQISGDAARYLEAHESGNIDETVGAVPTDWVPEYDKLDPTADRPRLIARGWRSIILALVSKKLVSLEKARRVFSSSLGESRHERLSLEERWRLEFPETHKRVNGGGITTEEIREMRARSLLK